MSPQVAARQQRNSSWYAGGHFEDLNPAALLGLEDLRLGRTARAQARSLHCQGPQVPVSAAAASSSTMRASTTISMGMSIPKERACSLRYSFAMRAT